MLKKYKQSGRVLSPVDLKSIRGGTQDNLPPSCRKNADCGTPYCSASVEELCWTCNPLTHLCIFVY